MRGAEFLHAFVWAVVGGFLLTAVANMVVDPFYRFHRYSVNSLNAQRTEFSGNVRMAKAGIICARNPSVVILGSSRAEVGLSPRHPVFAGASVYNLAMAGTGIGELLDTLKHTAHAAPDLKQVIVALDFFMFNAHREEVLFGTEVLDFDRRRLLVDPQDHCARNFAHDADRLIGFPGLVHVWRTLASQRSPDAKSRARTLTEAGWWTALYDQNGYRGDSYRVLESVAQWGHDESPHVHSGSSRDWTTFQVWGDQHAKLGQYEKAVEDFTAALHGSPPNAALYFQRGSALIELARFDEAIGDFQLGLKIEPENSNLKRLMESARQGRLGSPRRAFFFGDAADQELGYIGKIWRAGREHRYCFEKPGQRDTLEVFREIVRFARRSGLDVRFLINPIHARMLIALQEAGLWPQYEDWKRSLVRVLAEEAAETGLPGPPLWDFSGFNEVTTEPSPPIADRARIARWFWEPSHFREEAGNVMLEKVLSTSNAIDRALPDFGIELTPMNIETWLSRTFEAGRAYRGARADEVTVLKERLEPLFAVDWTGANCGDDVKAVADAARALRVGDRDGAAKGFAAARAIARDNETRARELGLPYREPDIERAIADAMEGRVPDELLDKWEDYQARGNDRVAKGDLKGAIADFSAALKSSPPNPALHFLRGTARLRIRDWRGAVEDFEAGLAIDPQNEPLKALLLQAERGMKASESPADPRRTN